MDHLKKLSKLSVGLHWFVGLAIIGLLVVGIYMTKLEVWSLYPVHKSTGVLIFPVIVMRALWRFKNGWPLAVGTYSRLVQTLAKATHWALLILTLLLPVTGMLFSAASGHGFGIFGFELFPENPSLVKPGEVIPFNQFLAEFGNQMHQVFAYLLVAAVLLHVAGALKHHFVDQDVILKRMLGRQV